MHKTALCQGCLEMLKLPIAIRGPFSPLYRTFGISRSQMHPNLCTMCEGNFAKVMKQKQVEMDTTVLFADLRGYTHLSQTLDPARMNQLLHGFYDRCSMAVWEQDGILNKFIGDAALAIFNFPLARKDHARKGVMAAMELQRLCHGLKAEIGIGDEHAVGIGIGVTTGTSSMGEVGNAYKDFTAIGPVVNLASRLQTAAAAGEILITEAVYDKVKDDLPALPARSLTLKGLDDEVKSYVIGAEVLEMHAAR
ncbi:MAG: adenylate/guanylate cyclase domain-containing protein [Flavobacteriales bacterium]